MRATTLSFLRLEFPPVSSIERIRPWLLPVGVMACLVVILMPLPTAVMDLLLAGNIAIAVVILLTAIHVASPLEFSVFPTLILATTLSRLVLNIATTRLILSQAPELGDQAAGNVIQTFGQFVAGNQIEVGLVIFLILVVVQFVVITKGATRISEVAARFALDGMPGRQSAIDADLNAGNIDAAAASRKRDDLIAEADFYSAMDGAGKFVRGDAIAGLVITVINVLCGLYLGVFVSGMGIGEAAGVFTKLTIGDGLVSQIPSLLISLAAGVLVTRGTRRSNLPDQLIGQLFASSKTMYLAAGFLLVMTLTGLPLIPLLMLAGGSLMIATTLRGNEQERDAEAQRARESETSTAANSQKRVEDFLAVDPLEVAIGLGLLPLADPSRGGDLMQRISRLRNQMAAEIGIVLPKVRVRDDATLESLEYEIRLFGDFVARGSLRTDKLLATDDGRSTGQLQGEPAPEFSSSGTATWIDVDNREQALIYGYKTQTAPGVLADHLEQTARNHADELLSHDATKHLLDELRQVAPALVDELVPSRLSVAAVQKVLQGLLAESIPIRQLGIIMESLGEASRKTDDAGAQIEIVRSRLSRTLCTQLSDPQRVLRVVRLDTEGLDTEGLDTEGLDTEGLDTEGLEAIDPLNFEDITCDAIRQAVKNLVAEGYPPVVLVGPHSRRPLKHAMTEAGIWTHVLSTNEISSDTEIRIHSQICRRPAATAAA